MNTFYVMAHNDLLRKGLVANITAIAGIAAMTVLVVLQM